MPALRALLRSICGIDHGDGNAAQHGFVFDKAAKLGETPAVVPGSLRSGNRCPGADALEDLKGDHAAGAFGLRDDLFGDLVVDVGPETGLFAGDLLQPPFGRLRAPLLQRLAVPGIAKPRTLDFIAFEAAAGRGVCEVRDAQIHTEDALWFGGVRRGGVVVNDKEVASSFFNKRGMAGAPQRRGTLFRRRLHADSGPAAEQPEAHYGVAFKRIEPLVVKNRTVASKVMALLLAGKLSGDFRDGADDHLRRKRRTAGRLFVEKMVDVVLTVDLRRKRFFADQIAGVVEHLHCALHQRRLLSSGQEFDLRHEGLGLYGFRHRRILQQPVSGSNFYCMAQYRQFFPGQAFRFGRGFLGGI